MAKNLLFNLGGTEYAALPVKLDRAKIYGWTDTIATDAQGDVCQSSYLLPEESLIVPSGAVKPATVDTDGRWLDKSLLKAVDEQGTPLPVYPSSFDSPIALEKTVSEEDFLDNDWDSVYQIENAELANAVGNRIYQFGFSYRGGTTLSDAYLISNQEGLFIFTGVHQKFPLVSLAEETVIDDDAEEEAEESIDDMDFGMF